MRPGVIYTWLCIEPPGSAAVLTTHTDTQCWCRFLFDFTLATLLGWVTHHIHIYTSKDVWSGPSHNINNIVYGTICLAGFFIFIFGVLHVKMGLSEQNSRIICF